MTEITSGFATVQVTLVFKSIPTIETCKSMMLCRKYSWQKTLMAENKTDLV